MTHVSGRRYDESNIEVVDLDTQQRTVVHQGGTYPRYIATGHLLFVRQSTLFAAPFDVSRLQVTAPPVPVLEGVGALYGGGTGVALYSVSANGTLAYLPMAPDGANPSALVFVDRKGSPHPFPRTAPISCRLDSHPTARRSQSLVSCEGPKGRCRTSGCMTPRAASVGPSLLPRIRTSHPSGPAMASV